MAKRNRQLKGAICVALTGDAQGECDEDPAGLETTSDAGSESESDAASEGEEQEHANNIANKQYPLAHRCLSNTEFRYNDLFESVLDRAKEVTMLVQDEKDGWGEGLDIGVAWLAVKEMRDEACAERLEVVSGAGDDETWKEISGTSLPQMFQKFRKVFAKELTKRFLLDTTPSRHVQLALQMNPTVNVSADGPLLAGKSAFCECMYAEYRRALKRQALQQASQAARPAAANAPDPADANATAVNTTDVNTTDAALAAPAAAHTPPPAPQPPAKRRRSLLGAVAVKQAGEVAVQDEDTSLLDLKVSAEIEKFEQLRCKTLAKGLDGHDYFGTTRFNLRAFWADHKTILPTHYAVYLAEVGCKKAAAANVEFVFSGAGKFTSEAPSTGAKLLQRMVKLHYNWKYPFLRPTMEKIIGRYNLKFRPTSLDPAAALAPDPTAAAPAPAPA